jgi:hypothetical protein
VEAVVVYFKATSQHLSGGSEEHQEKPRSGPKSGRKEKSRAMTGIEPRFSGPTVRCIVTIMTELSRLRGMYN